MTEDPLPDSWVDGMQYLHLPTPDLTAPGMEQIDEAVEFIHRRIHEKGAVLVHCAAGLGRAGTILACYMIKYEGHSSVDAISKIRRERPGSIQSYNQETAVHLYEKHAS